MMFQNDLDPRFRAALDFVCARVLERRHQS
jgi:hypothetical protein